MVRTTVESWKLPLIFYFAIAFFSLAVAILFWMLGDEVAELAGKTNYGLSFQAGGALAGFLIVLIISKSVISGLYETTREQIAQDVPAAQLPDSYAFARIVGEISATIDRIEADDFGLLKIYAERGDGERLLAGLYNSILYASQAVTTGSIDARFYGNMMALDDECAALRLRFFHGPYNDEILTRAFPLEGRAQGVATEAFNAGTVQVRNEMDSELKEKGEARLLSMMSVPVPGIDGTRLPREVRIINIDSGVGGSFPQPEEFELNGLDNRIAKLVDLTRRTNALERRLADGA